MMLMKSVRCGSRATVWAALALVMSACDGFKTTATCLDGRQPFAIDIYGDGLDNDCDGETDETAPVDSRAHCGRPWHSCVLRPGERDVVCVDATCVGVEPGTASFEPPDRCLDGIDDDGNGIVDDGPHCEALIANASRPACNGRAPSVDCPPAGFSMGHTTPPNNGKDDAWPRHPVHLTYDYLVDRYEASRGQYRQYLEVTGRCSGEPRDVNCEISDRLTDPMDQLTWCEAHTYCQWAGKRLPTEAEWTRLATARGEPAGGPYPWSDMPYDGDQVPIEGVGFIAPGAVGSEMCRRYGVATTDCLPTPAPVPVDQNGGWVIVGDWRFEPDTDPGSPMLIGRASSVLHVGGNIFEWTFDAFEHYCDTLGIDCFDPTAGAGVSPRPDPVVYEGRGAETRVLRGGSYRDLLASAEIANRSLHPARARVPGNGVRCVRTFAGSDPPSAAFTDTVPYDRRAPPSGHTDCTPDITAGDAVLAPHATLVGLCLPELIEANRGLGTAVNGVIDGDLKTPPAILALALDETDDPPALELGSAVVRGGALRWIAGGQRARGEAAAGCLLGECSARVPSETRRASLWYEATDRYDILVDVLDITPGAIAEAGCGLASKARDGDVYYTARVEVQPESPFNIAHESISELLCENFPGACLEETPDCVRACPGWGLTLQMVLRPMP